MSAQASACIKVLVASHGVNVQAAENGAALSEQAEELEAMTQRASAATEAILTLQQDVQIGQHTETTLRSQVCTDPEAYLTGLG